MAKVTQTAPPSTVARIIVSMPSAAKASALAPGKPRASMQRYRLHCRSLRTVQNDFAALDECRNTQCRDAYTACMPPDNCSILGGDCEPGNACVVETWGATYCQRTGGLPSGKNALQGDFLCGCRLILKRSTDAKKIVLRTATVPIKTHTANHTSRPH